MRNATVGARSPRPYTDTSDLPRLPEGWVTTTLGEIVRFEYGKALRRDRRSADGNVPVYGSNGLVGHHSTALVDEPCLVAVKELDEDRRLDDRKPKNRFAVSMHVALLAGGFLALEEKLSAVPGFQPASNSAILRTSPSNAALSST